MDDEICRSVLLTVLYSDLFDQALTLEELHRFLVLRRATSDDVAAAVDQCRDVLEESGELVAWKGREELFDWRPERSERARRMWAEAERYASWIQRSPWVRMVAVCGSLAVENPRPDGDIDLFLVAAPGRLWLVQVRAMCIKRLAALRGVDLCPNYFLTSAALEVRGRGLFVAREVVQARPVTGEDVHERFLRSNGWARSLLPNAFGDPPVAGADAGDAAEGVANGVGGRLAGWLDGAVHAALLSYYSLRLRGRGMNRRRLAASYRRDRQEVVAGGYASAVLETYRRRVEEQLDASHDGLRRDLDLLCAAVPEPSPDPSFSELLQAHYGPEQEGGRP